MKLTVERDVLAEVVTWTARIVPAHPATPVLAGLRFKAEQETVVISSFDYEVSSTATFAADVEEPGEVLVSGKLFADICKSLPHKPVNIELDGTKVRIKCGSARFVLMTMPIDTYPELPTSPKQSGSIDSRSFATAISQVSVAASSDMTLPLYTTVNMQLHGKTMTLMSTDRYRLAVRTLEWSPCDEDFQTQLLVRARTLQDMAKTLSGGDNLDVFLPVIPQSNDTENDEDSSLSAVKSTSPVMAMSCQGRTITTQLTDGDYPPVARLFPDESDYVIVVERKLLIEALRRVSLVIPKMAAVHLTFTDGMVKLEGGEAEDALAHEELPCEYSGEEITTAFNPRYLIEGLHALEDPYVRFSFTHPAKPALITAQKEAQGEDNQDFRYLLMPIRL